jgi:hypothetical protein
MKACFNNYAGIQTRGSWKNYKGLSSQSFWDVRVKINIMYKVKIVAEWSKE